MKFGGGTYQEFLVHREYDSTASPIIDSYKLYEADGNALYTQNKNDETLTSRDIDQATGDSVIGFNVDAEILFQKKDADE